MVTPIRPNVAGKQQLYDLINDNNELSIPLSDTNCTLGNPQVETTGHGNTSVSITAKPGSAYYGSASVRYTRLNLSDLWMELRPGDVATPQEFLDKLALENPHASGVPMLDDLETFIIPDDSEMEEGDYLDITITAKSTSYAWVGSQTISIHKPIMTLLSVDDATVHPPEVAYNPVDHLPYSFINIRSSDSNNGVSVNGGTEQELGEISEVDLSTNVVRLAWAYLDSVTTRQPDVHWSDDAVVRPTNPSTAWRVGPTRLNGKPVFTSNNTDHSSLLELSGPTGYWKSLARDTNAVTMAFLCRIDTATVGGWNDVLGAINTAGDVYARCYVQANADNLGDVMVGGRVQDYNGFDFTTEQAGVGSGWCMIIAEINALEGTVSLHVNGEAIITGSPWQSSGSNFSNTETHSIQFGGQLTKPNAASWAEFQYIRGALSTEERQQLEGYYGAEYGLQSLLPSDHPYRDAGPMVQSM